MPSISAIVSSLKLNVTSEQLAASTLNKVMETPLTPLGIVTGVGVFTIEIGLLKTIAWIIRKSPK